MSVLCLCLEVPAINSVVMYSFIHVFFFVMGTGFVDESLGRQLPPRHFVFPSM